MAKNVNIKELQTAYAKYWQKRAESNFLAGEKDALQVAKELKAVYKKAYKEIETKLNLFYGKYAAENKMTLEEAKKLLNKSELKDFKSYINDMIKMGKKENFTDEQLNEFKKLYAKAKVSRLDELQANIKYELDKLTVTNKKDIRALLENTYEEGY